MVVAADAETTAKISNFLSGLITKRKQSNQFASFLCVKFYLNPSLHLDNWIFCVTMQLGEKMATYISNLISKLVEQSQTDDYFPKNVEGEPYQIVAPLDYENLKQESYALLANDREILLNDLKDIYYKNKRYFTDVLTVFCSREEFQNELAWQNANVDKFVNDVMSACSSSCYMFGDKLYEEEFTKEIAENILAVRLIATAIASPILREIENLELLMCRWLMFYLDSFVVLAKMYFNKYFGETIDWDGDSFYYDDENNQKGEFMSLICALISGIMNMAEKITEQDYSALSDAINYFEPEFLINTFKSDEEEIQTDYIN